MTDPTPLDLDAGGRPAPRHNHVTRDVKPIGDCPGCDSRPRLLAALRDAQAEVAEARRDLDASIASAKAEVERLRKAVWASEEIDRRAGMLAGVEAERDTARAQVAAVLADLRALCDSWNGYGHGVYNIHPEQSLPCQACALLAQFTAVLDRHAPEETT